MNWLCGNGAHIWGIIWSKGIEYPVACLNCKLPKALFDYLQEVEKKWEKFKSNKNGN